MMLLELFIQYTATSSDVPAVGWFLEGNGMLTCQDNIHPITTHAAQQCFGSLLLGEDDQYSAFSMCQVEG